MKWRNTRPSRSHRAPNEPLTLISTIFIVQTMARYLLQSRIVEIPVQLSSDDTLFLKARKASIEAEATRLKAQILQLKHQYKAKRNELATICNILAPIRRLPFEILSSIFHEYCFGAGERVPNEPQLLISKVCSTWRQVAHGTPRLWSGFDIWFGRRNFVEHGAMMVDWLERSGSLPLNVSLRHGYLSSFPFPKGLLDRLVPFCNRLQSLALVLPIRILASFLDQSSFPVLKKLDLSLKNIDEPDLKPFLCHRFTAFLNSPHLKDVKFRGGSSYEHSAKIILSLLPLPAAQLQSLHLELRHVDSDPRSYLNVLQSCCTLVECRLLCPAWLRDPTIRIPPLKFPTLRLLSLEQWEDESESNFIDLITVPSLATFRIEHSEYGGDDPSNISEHLISLQTRSSAPLSTFELIRVRLMPTEDILSVLAFFPTLKHLKLCNCNLNTKLLMRGLQLWDDQPPLIPKLESLYLVDFEVIPKGSENFVVDMVESRTFEGRGKGKDSKVACLGDLTLVYKYHRFGDDMIKRLRKLLDLRLSEDSDSFED